MDPIISSLLRGSILLRICLASFVLFFTVINQRGLSGIQETKIGKSRAGKASTPSIQRQECSLSVPIKKWEREAIRMPRTRLNRNKAVRRPLWRAVEITERHSRATTAEERILSARMNPQK